MSTATDGKFILKPTPSTNQIKHEKDVVFNEHLSMLISKNIFKINKISRISKKILLNTKEEN